MKELKNDLKNYMLHEIYQELDDYEGTTQFCCDLGYTLFEYSNCNGTHTYSTQKAKEWIGEHWEDIGEVVEELKFQLGAEHVPNVFENPEAFMVVIMLELSSYMLGKCPYIEKRWNEEIELTPYRIKRIKKELFENNDTYGIYK